MSPWQWYCIGWVLGAYVGFYVAKNYYDKVD